MKKHKCKKDNIVWTSKIVWMEGSIEGNAKALCKCDKCGKKYYELFTRTCNIYDENNLDSNGNHKFILSI